jgi:hypothetical protein
MSDSSDGRMGERDKRGEKERCLMDAHVVAYEAMATISKS